MLILHSIFISCLQYINIIFAVQGRVITLNSYHCRLSSTMGHTCIAMNVYDFVFFFCICFFNFIGVCVPLHVVVVTLFL